jgi:hypothetical protein
MLDPKTNLWWTKDRAGHGGSSWKVYTQRGGELAWFADADEFGNFIVGKHKSTVGLTVLMSDMRAVP